MTKNKFPKKEATTWNNQQLRSEQKDTKSQRDSKQPEMSKYRNSVQSSSNMSEIGKNLIKNPVGTNTKKKTFNIGDFKKFKYMKNIESRVGTRLAKFLVKKILKLFQIWKISALRIFFLRN